MYTKISSAKDTNKEYKRPTKTANPTFPKFPKRNIYKLEYRKIQRRNWISKISNSKLSINLYQ